MIPRLVLAGALLALTACNRTRVRWEPSLVSHVPDSTLARFTEPGGSRYLVESIWYGRALGWNTSMPRLITPKGDTLAIPRGSKFEVLLPEKTGHANLGGALGYAAGALSVIADCGFERTCGEQNPVPLLAMALGTVIGAVVRTNHWIEVRTSP